MAARSIGTATISFGLVTVPIRLYTASENLLEGMDNTYRQFLHTALRHRPIVIGAGALSLVAAAFVFPYLNSELAPQTDEPGLAPQKRKAAGDAPRLEVRERVGDEERQGAERHRDRGRLIP